MTTLRREPPRVGAVRPSQLMYAYGVGSTVDLPNFSVVVAGLDDWDETAQEVVSEPRLLAAVREHVGPQVEELRSAPWREETRNAFDDWARAGVPVMPFPRWLRCRRCLTLAPIDSGLFQLKQYAYRPDLTKYVHQNCSSRGKPPTAVPARFLVACNRGHLDDFPWVEFTHTKGSCSGWPMLKALETGAGSRSTDLSVQCEVCEQKNHISQAFGDSALRTMPRCRGRHPHLRRFEDGCTERVKTMLLGASNSWFPLTISVLSLPVSADPARQAVEEHWDVLVNVSDETELRGALQFAPSLRGLRDMDQSALWAAINHRRTGQSHDNAADLKGPEWNLLRKPGVQQSRDFRVTEARAPSEFRGRIASVGLVERLREVVALTGFTRVDAPDSGVESDEPVRDVVSLSREDPRWVPASEVRGEGVFIELPEAAVQRWAALVAEREAFAGLAQRHDKWRARRALDPTDWPGERFVLLHSLAHSLILGLALESGYGAASIRERIYSRESDQGEPMAGILLYTAAPDSEGTLGGLVRLGRPENLARLLQTAIERARLCSSDPICAERMHDPDEESLHEAACHACLFVPETSCESGNRYLDRAALVETLAQRGIGYFGS